MFKLKLVAQVKKYLKIKTKKSDVDYKGILALLTTDLLHLMTLPEQTEYLASIMHCNSVYQDFLTEQGRLQSVKNLGKVEHNIELRKLLSGKTQVHPGHDNNYPDRSTHTNNVRNLTREILQALGLNSYLGEAVAFAHDIGHCAFGHAGERELDTLLAEELGGFDHKLAGAYIAKRLLNYQNEIVEGIALHSGKPAQIIYEAGALSAERIERWNNIDLNKEYKKFVKEKSNHASFLESALVSFIDEFEYLGTDIEAELKRGKISATLLPESFKKIAAVKAPNRNPIGNPFNDVKAAFLDIVMADLKENTKKNLDEGKRILKLSSDVAQMIEDLKDFANLYIYMHKDQKEVDQACMIIMRTCFNYYKKYKYNEFKDLNVKQRKEAFITLLIQDILYKDDKDLYELFLQLTKFKNNLMKISFTDKVSWSLLGKKVATIFKKHKILF